MSFKNVVRKSLGFEEVEEPVKHNNLSPQGGATAYYEYDVTIYPDDEYYEKSNFEIMLIRPKTIDDINYVIDQIIEEKNPVIIDLSFLERESPANYKLATDKINYMRANFGAEALLLAHTNSKNLIILSPDNIKLSKK